MSAKLSHVIQNFNQIKGSLQQNKSEDKVGEKVDWLVDNPRPSEAGKPLTAN